MKRIVLLSILLTAACQNSDTYRYVRDDTAIADTDSDTDSEPDAEPDVKDTGTPWWENSPHEDADGDGWTTEAGDCNDLNALIHPNQTDWCNGIDNDCDGLVDEDVDGDAGETQLIGDLTEIPEYLLYPTLFPASDEDRFDFYVEDSLTGWFDIEIWLYQIPTEADYALELYWTEDIYGNNRGRVDSADAFSFGGFEAINYAGQAGRDDSGWYQVVVRSKAGATCAAPYQLQFLIGGW